MERIVDPTLADWRTEYEDAVQDGRKWKSHRVWMAGYVTFFKMAVLYGSHQTLSVLQEVTDADRRVLIRTFGLTAMVATIATVLLAAVPFLDFVSPSHPNAAELALYVIPQALPLSIPIGITFGVLWGLGRAAASWRPHTLVLLVAMLWSGTSFTMLGWLVPAANQAFRVSLAGRPVAKGANELTLGELARVLESTTDQSLAGAMPSDVRDLSLNYHSRWAVAAAPLVLAVVALAVTRRRRWSGMSLGLIGCVAIAGYYVAISAGRWLVREHSFSAFAAAWAPNIAFLMISIAIMNVSALRSDAAARA